MGCVDQSNLWTACLSWSVFLLLAIVVPLNRTCSRLSELRRKHSQPYDSVVQIVSHRRCNPFFIVYLNLFESMGFGDSSSLIKLCDESPKVRQGYTEQLHRSLKLLSVFVLPCFAAESAYKIWWYSSGATRIPFLGNAYVSDAIACMLELCSWLYRTSIFFLVCVLFRLICYLQILRLQDFAQLFQEESDVASVLKEHLRIRRHLRIISHRYRAFILSTLIFVTASQLASLLITTRSHAEVTILKAGELAFGAAVLRQPGDGALICLRSATKITHKAQSVTCLAAKWHVTYFENNRAGITVFGFILDRTWLHTIFGIEMSLFLWLLSKTIGFS
ncbi:hypothetical protein HHK36_023918 [Tetracentron sinense]|uniref:Uncharacterized protein n=1 Tax=Tetracentron sinense TaxID=13715 RepID=A0A834YTC7_TETSI|nr:hypothetical protein HHK36_023918 [Tetracentron sinense]